MSGRSAPPEFSRPVLLARLGNETLRREIVASEAEREALARRFSLVALDRLSAVVELVRKGAGVIRLNASFEADFVQECVVTLDPVGGAVADRFTLIYGPPEAEEAAMGVIGDAEVAFEPLSGDAIDIGEAVAQEFSLALPLFPRSASADAAAGQAASGEAGPFAALARLFERPGGGRGGEDEDNEGC